MLCYSNGTDSNMLRTYLHKVKNTIPELPEHRQLAIVSVEFFTSKQKYTGSILHKKWHCYLSGRLQRRIFCKTTIEDFPDKAAHRPHICRPDIIKQD